MNLFRSEEHIRKSSCFVEGTEEGITPLPDMVKLFSGPYFSRRLDPDYVSHMHTDKLMREMRYKHLGSGILDALGLFSQRNGRKF